MNLAKMIDHTQLKANATREQVKQLCDEAAACGFASVCVNSCWVSYCAELLVGTGVNVCTVVGFPLGAASTAAKVAETAQAVADGAAEIDMVINIGQLVAGEDEKVAADIAAVVEAARPAIVKVIIECCLLNDEQKVRACEIVAVSGAAFVKTSTGFSTGGATVADVALMAKIVADRCQVKAAGGIHTAAEAQAMVDAGATRIGTSSGLAILGK